VASWRPDPTFHRSAAIAAQAPREEQVFVATFRPRTGMGPAPDALAVVDVRPDSSTYGSMVGRLEMPNVGDELHRLGWNACSSALSPSAAHPHVERRHLILLGIRSSRIYVIDVKDDPFQPRLVKVIEGDELAARTGYSRPHTVRCGVDGIYVSALGRADGGEPGGVCLLDPETYDPIGAWEEDRGPQQLAHDVWWNVGFNALVTSEWGTPLMVEAGFDGDLLRRGEYGHRLHVWDQKRRTYRQTLELDKPHQMLLEVRPAHDPSKPYGFVESCLSNGPFGAAVWLWDRAGGPEAVRLTKILDIPAEPVDAPERLPPVLEPFGVIPPLPTDIVLSLDDRWLYVSCWGTGQLRRYDVRDPHRPRLTACVHVGGIQSWSAHPAAGPLNGGPQMVEVSLDGRRVYVTNSFYGSWDDQFYPEGIEGWMVLLHAGEDGSLTLDPDFFVPFGGERPVQVRLSGGDSSSDTFCFAS
jgi:methanethiol oxidase